MFMQYITNTELYPLILPNFPKKPFPLGSVCKIRGKCRPTCNILEMQNYIIQLPPDFSKTFSLERFCMCGIYQKCRHTVFNSLLNFPKNLSSKKFFWKLGELSVIIIIILHF